MGASADPDWKSSKDAILRHIADEAGEWPVHYPIRNGTMRAGLYAPKGTDPQTPHDQDELYIIASGTADFVKESHRVAVRAQDMLFVEAGADHRFKNMSDDFATWVIFWGAKGGEG